MTLKEKLARHYAEHFKDKKYYNTVKAAHIEGFEVARLILSEAADADEECGDTMKFMIKTLGEENDW